MLDFFLVTTGVEETPAVDCSEATVVCGSRDFLQGISEDTVDKIFGTKMVGMTICANVFGANVCADDFGAGVLDTDA